MKKQEELGAVIIINIAKNNRPEVNALLLRNGVSLPNEASDLQVAQVITELLKKSKTFKNEFINLMKNSDVISEMSNEYLNFGEGTNVKDFSQYGVPSTFNGTVKPLYLNAPLTSNSSLTTPSLLSSVKTDDEKKSSGTGFTLDKGLGIFSQALNGFLQYNQNVTDQKLAEASIAQAQAGGLDAYGKANPDDSQGMGTGMIVFLTMLGLAVVGGGAWWYIKSQK